jgi:hypothetical protein
MYKFFRADHGWFVRHKTWGGINAPHFGFTVNGFCSVVRGVRHAVARTAETAGFATIKPYSFLRRLSRQSARVLLINPAPREYVPIGFFDSDMLRLFESERFHIDWISPSDREAL